MKSKTPLVAFLVAATALVFTGCGGDDGGNPDAATIADGAEPPDAVEIPPDGPTPDAAFDAGPDASPDAAIDAMLGPETCDNGMDDNGDGKADCDDPQCASSFFPCQAPLCADGQQRVFLHATDLPKLIHGGQTTTSTIAVPAGGAVVNAAAKVSIGHGYVTDIVIHLTSPENTTIDLSSNNGSNGHNYLATVFSDAAAMSIRTGTAPFTGVWKPEQPFSGFNGQQSGGNWRMDVIETFFDGNPATDDGGFASFDLMLCECTTCEVGPNCSDHTDNDGDGMIDCADPDCATNLRCIPETACADGMDNDLDGQIDCKDDQCNGHDHCEFEHEASCHDSFDNDGDGQSDCSDSDCASTALCLIESNCTDGMDNDMDGLTDCADPGCFAGAPGCQTTESTCDDHIDNDGDGLVDCDDPNCQTTVTCAVPACAAGQQTLMLTATDVPVAVPDNSPAGVTSTIHVGTTGTVNRVIVTLGATHTFDGDLLVGLVGPGEANPGVVIANRIGSAGDNFTDTVFSDTAAVPIASGTAPFTGPFKPSNPLSALNGHALAGDWKLFASDNASIDTGSLTKFQLYICYTP